MIRRPPRSTLFPYRRSSDLSLLTMGSCCPPGVSPSQLGDLVFQFIQRHHIGSSEEHTSELQSRFDLVSRLLLEKNTTTVTLHHTYFTSCPHHCNAPCAPYAI